MSWLPPPTEEQLAKFFAKLRAWRATLAESEQRLVDSMVAAALGVPSGGYSVPTDRPGDDDEQPASEMASTDCWDRSISFWLATPWGLAYTLRY
jgi:hypothetical protein